MKTLIVYESKHHGNTKKLVDAICEKYKADAANIENATELDLNSYDAIGLAAGIAFGRMYPEMEKFASEHLPENSKVFFIYTCGKDTGKYTNSIKRIAVKKHCDILGEYGCQGYDTFGPFKLIGGIAKGHPTDEEIRKAVEFYGSLKL